MENDGWEITDDPYIIELSFEDNFFSVDLGASKILNAFKGEKEVLIEIKSLNKGSIINEFHTVLGQFLNYRDAIEAGQISRTLYLGVSLIGYERLIDSPFIKMQIDKYRLKFVIINIAKKIVHQWIS